MSVQQATFIIKGFKFDLEELEKTNPELSEKLGEFDDDKHHFTWSTRNGDMDGEIGVLYDGMDGKYCIVGILVKQTRDRMDGDYFYNPVAIPEFTVEDYKLIRDFLLEKFGCLVDIMKAETYVIDHHC